MSKHPDNNSGALAPFLDLQHLERLQGLDNRTVAQLYALPINMTEGQLLSELAVHPDLTAAQFAAFTDVAPMTVSRCAAKLAADGLLTLDESEYDRRCRRLRLTNRGRTLLADFDSRANQRAAVKLNRLAAAEQDRLVEYFRICCKGLGARPLSFRPGMHRLRPYISGISRKRGMLSGRMFGIERISLLHWHILCELQQHPGQCSATDLSTRLSSPIGSVNQAVRTLSARRHLARSVNLQDRRQQLLKLSKSGARFLQRLQTAGANQLRESLSQLQPAQVADCVQLFRRYVGAEINTALTLQISLTLSRLNPDQYAAARTFLLEELVRANRHHCVQPTLLAEGSMVFALRSEQNYKALIELTPEKRRWRVVHLAAAPDLDDTPMLESFIRSALEQALTQEGCSRIYVPPEWAAAAPEWFARCTVRGTGRTVTTATLP